MKAVHKRMVKEIKSRLQEDPQPHTENPQSQKWWTLGRYLPFSNPHNLQVLFCQGRGPIPCSFANFESSVSLRLPKCWNMILGWALINYERKQSWRQSMMTQDCTTKKNKIVWAASNGQGTTQMHVLGAFGTHTTHWQWMKKKKKAIFQQECVVFS